MRTQIQAAHKHRHYDYGTTTRTNRTATGGSAATQGNNWWWRASSRASRNEQAVWARCAMSEAANTGSPAVHDEIKIEQNGMIQAARGDGKGEITMHEKGYAFFESIGRPRFHVAPMVDQSELPFRLLCRRHGATAAYTPMLHARLFLENDKYREEHFTTTLDGSDRPLFVQFCANDPQILLGAARLVQDRCDAIDINLGCPQRIAKRGRYGAFLMDELDTVEAMVRTLHDNLDIPVTCKVRIFPEMEKTLQYVKMIERAGCSLLTVHGRTREMKSAKDYRADWDAIRCACLFYFFGM